MDVNEYRRRTPRCRTCQHAKEEWLNGYGDLAWRCEAKNVRHRGNLASTKLYGCLCGLYKAKED